MDFDEVERARKVDGRLRELLRWGIAEPGGSGGSKGLPSSFLATVLLSTQSEVSAILSDSLQADPSGSGKERIAAALQAVGQDPLFVALLRDTQARRDAAYTEKGARKTAKGSVFKDAADRLREVRDEKERLQKLVEDSESVEQQLRDLNGRLDARESAVVAAREHTKSLELLSAQAAALAIADEQVRLARGEVARILQLGADAEAAERTITGLAVGVTRAGQALHAAQERLKVADAAFRAAGDAAKAAGANSTTTATVVRQKLELRRAAADHASRNAQQEIDRALAAQGLVDAAESAQAENRKRQAETARARGALAEAVAGEQASAEQLRQLEVLERALESRAADQAMATAQADLEKEVILRTRLESESRELEAIVGRRAAITVPALAALAPMRRLANELAAARGALNVGLVVTVTPRRALDIRVHKDGVTTDVRLTSEPHEESKRMPRSILISRSQACRFEAADRKRSGRCGRSSGDGSARSLRTWPRRASRNSMTSAPWWRTRERSMRASRQSASSWRRCGRRIASLAGAAEALRAASGRSKAAREALGGTPVESLSANLTALGADPTASLRKRRQQLSADLDAARSKAGKAGTDHSLAEERSRTSKATLDAAVAARDTALAALPEGLATTLAAARASLATARHEEEQIHDEVEALESTIAAETARIAAAVSDTEAAEQHARAAVDAAQQALTQAVAEQASQAGRLEELRRQRDAQDLPGAENRLRETTESPCHCAGTGTARD